MVKKILIVFLVILLFSLIKIAAFAEESDMPEEYENFIDGLPDDIAELLPEGLFSNNSDSVIDAINEMTGWEYLIDIAFKIIGLNLKDIVKILASIISVLIISSLFNAMKKTVKNESTASVLQLVASLILTTLLIELAQAPLKQCFLLLDNLKLFSNTVSPLICTMYAMGGNISTALASNYGLIVFLTVFENVCVLSLKMILGICVSITFASAFINDGNLLALSSAIKKAFTFFVGLIMLVFTTVVSTQSLISAKADTLTSKAAKLLAGQMIPVVGNTVGETLKTAGASIEYLRSSVGVALIVILVILIMPTLISIFLYRVVFIFSNAVAGILDCRKEGSILLELSSIYGYALAILSVCAIALLFLITVFAKSTSPLT